MPRYSVFQFHLDNETSFVLQQGQSADPPKYYDQPLEYYVTGESGSCVATSVESSTSTASSIGSYTGTANGWGAGTGGIKYKFTPGTETSARGIANPETDTLGYIGIRPVAGPVDKIGTTTTKPTTVLGDNEISGGKMFGNSDGTKEGYSFGQQGYSKSVQTSVKRAYYTAGK